MKARSRVHHYPAAVLYALAWSTGAAFILVKLGSPVWVTATVGAAVAVTLLTPVYKSWSALHPADRLAWQYYLFAATPALVSASLISAVMLAVGLPGWLAGEVAGSIVLGSALTLIWRSRARDPR